MEANLAVHLLNRLSRRSGRRLSLASLGETGQVVVTARADGDGIHIQGAELDHGFHPVNEPFTPPQSMDAAALGLAAISMSTGLRITLDAPVSASMARQMSRVAQVYRLWSFKTLAPLRLDLPVTTPDPAPAQGGGILCLSGGIDSTYAAVTGAVSGRIGQGVLISGADYAEASAPGFVELRERVGAVADRLGLGLSIVETNIRRQNLHWEMMHAFVLAAVLHGFSSRYAHGGFALDYADYQELVQHPWGNNATLPGVLSTASFPISGHGSGMRRVDKLEAIAEHDHGLLEHLSVCWSDRMTGGNCGHCRKCITTRLAFHALGLPEEKTFRTLPPLLDALDAFRVARDVVTLRGQLVRTCELTDALPDGPLRNRLREFEGAVREAYHRTIPPV